MGLESFKGKPKNVLKETARAAALGAMIVSGTPEIAEAKDLKPKIETTAKTPVVKSGLEKQKIIVPRISEKNMQAPKVSPIEKNAEPRKEAWEEWRQSKNLEIQRGPSQRVIRYREDIFKDGFWSGVKKLFGSEN